MEGYDYYGSFSQVPDPLVVQPRRPIRRLTSYPIAKPLTWWEMFFGRSEGYTIEPTLPPGKKGFVVGNQDTSGGGKVDALGANWYYTWGPTPLETPPPSGVLFTPMFWNIAKTTNPTAVINTLKTLNVPGQENILLTYNEPDGTNASAQANMKVGDAVAFWPQIVSTGRRLGSPVMYGSVLVPPKTPNPNNTPLPAGGSAPVTVNISNTDTPNNVTLNPQIWLDNFLIQISKLTPATHFPDFICIHWYGPPNPNSFLTYIQNVYNKYKLPIWITEYSSADWTATCCPGGVTKHTVVSGINWAPLGPEDDPSDNSTANFMQQTMQGLESMSFVERYTWKERFRLVPFTNPNNITGDSAESPTNPDVMGQSVLFDSYMHFPTSTPDLTPLGQLYAKS